MKKFIAFAALALGLLAGRAQAEYRPESYIRSAAVEAKYFFSGITTSTSVILVDLSSTSIHGHTGTGEVDVIYARVQIDKVAASSATVKMGVITRINATNGDLKYFFTKHFDKDTVGTSLEADFIPGPAATRLKVNSDATTPFFASNYSSLNDTTYQTDVYLLNISGNSVFPAVGDVILRVDFQGSATATNITVELFYYTER